MSRQNVNYLIRSERLRAFKRKGKWQVFATDVRNYVKRNERGGEDR